MDMTTNSSMSVKPLFLTIFRSTRKDSCLVYTIKRNCIKILIRLLLDPVTYMFVEIYTLDLKTLFLNEIKYRKTFSFSISFTITFFLFNLNLFIDYCLIGRTFPESNLLFELKHIMNKIMYVFCSYSWCWTWFESGIGQSQLHYLDEDSGQTKYRNLLNRTWVLGEC